MLTTFGLFILADVAFQFLSDPGELVAFLWSEDVNPE